MSAENIVRIVAGFLVLLSLALGVTASQLFVSQNFLWFTTFIGVMLLQSGFTGICPMKNIMALFGIKDRSC